MVIPGTVKQNPHPARWPSTAPGSDAVSRAWMPGPPSSSTPANAPIKQHLPPLMPTGRPAGASMTGQQYAGAARRPGRGHADGPGYGTAPAGSSLCSASATATASSAARTLAERARRARTTCHAWGAAATSSAAMMASSA